MDMGHEFETEQVEPQPIVAIRATTTPSELGRQFEKWLPAVRRFLEERGLRVAGPSIARYHDYREDFVGVEAGYVGKKEGAGPWEIYWTGLGDESDSSKWRTEIRRPVG
jgi:hypothetical protein